MGKYEIRKATEQRRIEAAQKEACRRVLEDSLIVEGTGVLKRALAGLGYRKEAIDRRMVRMHNSEKGKNN
jgi:hypothetical protein